MTATALAVPSVAGAASTSTTSTPTLPTNLWLVPAVGGAVALVVVFVASAVSGCWKRSGWQGTVQAFAWDLTDSWVTNATAVGGALTGILTGSIGSFFSSSIDTTGFTVMSLILAGAAAMAPVVYGALAKSSGPSTPSGSRAGLMLASVFTLLATFGLLVDIGLLVSYSIATSADKGILYGALIVASVVFSIYTVRSINDLVNPPPPPPGGGGGAQAAPMSSLLSAKRSATL